MIFLIILTQNEAKQKNYPHFLSEKVAANFQWQPGIREYAHSPATTKLLNYHSIGGNNNRITL